MAMSSAAWARRLWTYRGEEEMVSPAGQPDHTVRSTVGTVRDD